VRKAVTSVADGASAHSGGQAEQRDARQEGKSAPEDIADAAGGHHECAQREHVDADHPLQVGCGRFRSNAIRGNARFMAK
jgi:hypothetical protein